MKRSQIQILNDYMQGMNTMIDASSQLVHQYGKIEFMAVRGALQAVLDATTSKLKKAAQ